MINSDGLPDCRITQLEAENAYLKELLGLYRDLARGFSQRAPGVVTWAQSRILKLEKEYRGEN